MIDSGNLGSFSIGSYPDLALHYLPPVLQDYRARYPDARIKVVARPYQILMESLESGEVDMALVHAPDQDVKDVTFLHLFDAPFSLLAPIGHPLLDKTRPSLETISEWPLILLSLESYTRRYFENAMNEEGLRLQVGLEMDHSELARRYVEIGMGVAVTITEMFAVKHDASSKIGVVDLSHIFPPVQIGVAVKASHELSAAALEFIADLKSAAINARPQTVGQESIT